MVFSNAHCQWPVCGPSRASIMTGLLPSTLGLGKNNSSLSIKDDELQERALKLNTELIHTYFNRNGYRTMAVGKLCHQHVPEGSVDASGGRGSVKEGTGILKKNWSQKGTSTDWAMAPERDDQLPDHAAAEWAVNQLQEEHDKPFFLMVGFLRPHVPWYVPKKWYDLYDKTKLTLPPYREDDLDDVPAFAKEFAIREDKFPSTDWAIQNNQWRNILHAYLACVSFADHQVGKVLEALDASPYKDNTIIVFWSDHGYHLGEKNTFQKNTLWERSSHAPLIIDDPSVKKGGRCDRVVSLLDIYPTLVELCGLPQNPKNEGRSLAPLLKNPSKNWPYPAITGWKQNSFAVQDERYRYIRYGDGSEELYDHQNDPNEWTNVADNPVLAGIKAKLAKHLPKTNTRVEREPIAE
jgi:arylsulfatase A-like enzyme